jgi:stage V sporulation protein G
MKITDVKVFPVDEDKLKAYATITFDNSFIVRDLKVISGNKGYFIAMPSKKRKDGTFRDVAHPLNSETRKMIENAVLDVYKKEIASGSEKTDYTEDEMEEAVPEPEADSEKAEEPSSGSEDSEEPVSEEPVSEEPVSEEPVSEEPVSEEPVSEEPAKENENEPEKRAEENPDVEPSDDPDKAFGYEE